MSKDSYSFLRRGLPSVKLLHNVIQDALKEHPDEVCECRLPDAKIKFVHDIWDEELVEIHAEICE